MADLGGCGAAGQGVLGAFRSVAAGIVALSAALVFASAPKAEIYRWTDDEGRTHFSQDLGQVPAHKRAAAQQQAQTPAPDNNPIQRYDVQPPARRSEPANRASSQTGGPGTSYRIPVQRAGTSMLVTVKLNNRVDARFLVDTGASDVLLPQRVADQLGLAPSGRTKVYSTANGLVTHDVVSLDSVALGGATAQGVVASVSPTMEVGLLGLSFFNHFQYSVDPVEGVIKLTPNGLKEAGLIRAGRSKAQWKAEYGNLRLRIRYNEDRRGRVMRSHTRTHAQLEDEMRDLERQLAVLDIEADRARVPYSWRR